jgi:hypothetical protein
MTPALHDLAGINDYSEAFLSHVVDTGQVVSRSIIDTGE